LEGPFAVSNRRIVNALGEVAIRAATNKHAEVVGKLLNAAHCHGTPAKLLGNGEATSQTSA